MEPFDAPSWLTNLEMNYSSFLEDFEQYGELVQFPMIPDVSYLSPENCLSDSTFDLNTSPDVNITPPLPNKNKSNVVTKHAKKKSSKPRCKSWNSCFKKEKNDIKKFGKSDGNMLKNSSSNANKRKRIGEAHDANIEMNDADSTEVANQQESNKKGHVMAERKRREKLTQRFIALSSLLPDITRMDKASVLGDAIKYVNHLQERVKALEAQATQTIVKPTVIPRKSKSTFPADECNSSTCDGNSSLDIEFGTKAESPPEIDIRFLGRTVLVKIHCMSDKGIVSKALSAIESFGLTVISASAVAFARSCDITITAKVNEEIYVTPEDLVRRLNFGLKKLWL